MIALLTLIFCFISTQLVSGDTLPDQETFDQISSIYTQLLDKLAYNQTELRDKYSRPIARNDYFLNAKGFSNYSDIWMTIHGPLQLTFFCSPLQLRSVHSKAIEERLQSAKGESISIPTLTIEDAYREAEEYLLKIGCKMPSDYQLGEIRFNGTWRSCWEVRWWRVADGIYPQDRFNPVDREDVAVVFHETLGLVVFGSQTNSPPPKSLAVKINREDAILKAARTAPLVLTTPFYRETRASGFIIGSLKEANLQIAIPNWLLDPARAVWMRDKPPDETRLCWIVRFATINGKKDSEQGVKLVPPDILIYVDAANGDIVGANFS